jgi:3-phosphoshikimate 1-carboxyvinyltransferase
MIYRITAPEGPVKCTVNLPSSKSISNRALIIRSLAGGNGHIENLSEAEDTKILSGLLESGASELFTGDGGTTARFFLAYACAKGIDCTLTGSESLSRRPVAPLVDALRLLGADISYLEGEGGLPVKIKSSSLNGGPITLDGSVSSQFISALMMIGPAIGGIEILITGEILSQPYIRMTMAVMKHYGVEGKYEENRVIIPAGKYRDCDITIEPDWSAASYWYEIAALRESSEIVLPKLVKNSLQGDARIAEFMEPLDVVTCYDKTGVKLSRNPQYSNPEYYCGEFLDVPDLGPAVAAACAGLNLTADLFGLKNFRLKESDRAAALQRELYHLGVNTDFCGGSKFKLFHGSGLRNYRRPLKTYNDHRIAMALAPLSLVSGSLLIDNPKVTDKSYPGFWSDLQLAGFKVELSE